MTDSQQRYQQYVEEKRHNYAMERQKGRELDISQQATNVKEREVATKEAMLPYEQSLAAARTSETEWKTRNEGRNFVSSIADFFFGPIKQEVSKGRDGIMRLFR
jgi:hypothetical protein